MTSKELRRVEDMLIAVLKSRSHKEAVALAKEYLEQLELFVPQTESPRENPLQTTMW